MKKRKLFNILLPTTLALSASLVACSNSSEQDSEIMLHDINFNHDWQFRLEGQQQVQDINLPHDFSISQNFDFDPDHKVEAESGFLPGGVGYYTKKFVLPELKDKSIVINFDGSYAWTTVTINGTTLGTNMYGYNQFAFDLSDYLICDGKTQNILEVKVENPLETSRWYSGSGIYRDVTLSITNKLHISRDGVYIATPRLADNDGTVIIETEVNNDYISNMNNISVSHDIYDQQGQIVATVSSDATNIPSMSRGKLISTTKVDNYQLWDLNNPYLYTVKTNLYSDGKKIDELLSNFGFRYIEYGKQGFKINGRFQKIFGVCLHHDQGALGAASYNDAIFRQLLKMKEMGMNAIRTSHNCPDKDLVRMCDRLGLLVLDEAFDGWYHAKGDNPNDISCVWGQKVKPNFVDKKDADNWEDFIVKSLVRRDRNSPSVILWSIGNEIYLNNDKQTNVSIAQRLINDIYEEDSNPTHRRRITTGDDSRPANPKEYDWGKEQVTNTVYRNGGLVGYNYGSTDQWDAGMKAYDRICASESASAISSRGMYKQYESNIPNNPQGGEKVEPSHDGSYHLMSYDNCRVLWGATAHEALYRTLHYDRMSGQYVWTGFDYIGEPTPWNGANPGYRDFPLDDEEWDDTNWRPTQLKHAAPNTSYFGIVDTAGFEKDSFYLYRAHQRLDDTTLHLVGSLDSNNYYVDDKGDTRLDVYTNAPSTEIYYDSGSGTPTLLATITRTLTKGDGGDNSPYTYYTYEATAESSQSICSVITRTEDDPLYVGSSLYSSLKLKWSDINNGSIYAVAYDDNKEVISDTVGTKYLTHPDYATKQMSIRTTTHSNEYSEEQTVTLDNADKALAYVEVSLIDDEGNPIIQTNPDDCLEIEATILGQGQILGVDNGDQATINKFQNPTVLINKTHAKIKFYAGKALVIVKGTDKGSFNLMLDCNSETKVINFKVN